jgi:hypothetical protein
LLTRIEDHHYSIFVAYKRSLADFLCQDTGGPFPYTGLDIITAHKGRGVTAEAF